MTASRLVFVLAVLASSPAWAQVGNRNCSLNGTTNREIGISAKPGGICKIDVQGYGCMFESSKVTTRPKSGIFGWANPSYGVYKVNDDASGKDYFEVTALLQCSGVRQELLYRYYVTIGR